MRGGDAPGEADAMGAADYVVEPHVIMTGCRAWPVRPEPGGPCPVCGGGIRAGDDRVYCAACDGASPGVEARLRSARVGLKAREGHRAAEERAGAALRKQTRGGKVELTEAERRRIFNGYKGGIAAALGEDGLTNRARAGREFLARIGQLPDFTIALGRGGRVLGRAGADGEGAEDWG
jgi:hypothetical protein